MKKLWIQLHTHSHRSFDSVVTVGQYVDHLQKILGRNEYAILGITDHNALPISVAESIRFSSDRVLVIPGIEWNLEKTIKGTFRNLATRREVITIGNQDDLGPFLQENTNINISSEGRFGGKPTEKVFLDYVAKNPNIAVIVPHPAHFGIEWHNRRTLKKLHDVLKKNNQNINFFVEDENGADPFPRILYKYRVDYNVLGGSDSHRLQHIFGVNSVNTVQTVMSVEDGDITQWFARKMRSTAEEYTKNISNIMSHLANNNQKVEITRDALAATLNFAYCSTEFIRSRFRDFPRRLIH